MTYAKSTAEMMQLLEEIIKDVPKALSGNKTASQRIRTKTILLSKVSKDWRKKSLDLERKKTSKKKSSKKPRAGKTARK